MSTSTHNYPLFLDLTDRKVVVVGAGPVGTRRAETAVAAGAIVHIVAPEATTEVELGAVTGRWIWHRRAFRPDDVEQAWLVHAATGVSAVDDAVVQAADADRIWSVRASSAELSRAATAASETFEGVTVAVHGGRDPRRATAVRTGIADRLRNGDIPLRRRRKPAPEGGSVALVGAGPGDPELLTIRARRLLRAADVVIADHLAPAAVLADLDADVEIRYAGKRPGQHSLTQEQINELMVSRARDGHRVVRLKGGDPFLLGRGGEEALACIAAGLPVEVVPGVTSAVAVPAAAGIPVTHRGITSSFVLLSGHAGVVELRRELAGAPATSTLVLLMGTATLSQVAAEIVASGRSPQTPAAIIERGWTPEQRTVVGALGNIAERAGAAGVGSPAIVVIGDVVALRDRLGDLAVATETAGHVLPEHTRDSVPAPAAVLLS